MFCGLTEEHNPHIGCAGFAAQQDWDNTRSVWCHRKDGGILTYRRDDYGSLQSGGSYEIWDCTIHGPHYFNLPD